MIVGTAALLIIDMQHDFLDADGAVPCVGGWQIVPGIQQLATAARHAGVPVIYTQEMHRPTRIDFGRELDGTEGLHCVEGTHGVQIVPDLMPQDGDTLVRKRRYSAFLGTDLPYILNGFGVHPGDTLIITGVATDVCVHYTAADAHQYDYRVRVVTECVAGTSLEAHTAALAAINYLQADSLLSRGAMVEALANYPRPQLAARAVSGR